MSILDGFVTSRLLVCGYSKPIWSYQPVYSHTLGRFYSQVTGTLHLNKHSHNIHILIEHPKRCHVGPFRSELAKQPYITMCVRECMRLFPPVPWIGRLLDKSITFLDGREVPKGVMNLFHIVRFVTVVFFKTDDLLVWMHQIQSDPRRYA